MGIKYIRDTHNANTRYKNNFRLPKVNSEMAKKNVYYDGMKMYNELPNNIKESVTLEEFKRKCTIYIRERFEAV